MSCRQPLWHCTTAVFCRIYDAYAIIQLSQKIHMVLDTKHKRRPAPTLAHKKRVGAHQKQSQHFMKTYWPYLPLFVVLAIVVIVGGLRMLGPTGAVIGSVGVIIAGLGFLL